MKTRLLLVFFWFTLATFSLYPQEEVGSKTNSKGIDYDIGLNMSINKVKIKLGEDDLINTLSFSYLALRVDADLLDFLNVGIIAGVSSNQFNQQVDFVQLPLSLRFGEEKYNSMNFGLNVKSEFSISRDISLQARGQYLFFKLFEKEYAITLPVASGTATTTNSFSQITVALLAQYDGLTNLTLYAGPQINMLSGKFKVKEVIEEINAEDSIDYKQKSMFGFEGGAAIDIGDHLNLDVRFGIGGKTFVSASIFYIF